MSRRVHCRGQHQFIISAKLSRERPTGRMRRCAQSSTVAR